MRRRSRSARLAAALAGIALAPAATAYEFTQVIRGGTTTPGVNVNFTDVRAPSLDRDDLAFCGTSYLTFGKNGYYHVDLTDGAVTEIATDSTPNPSGGGNFRDMCITANLLPSIDDGEVAFSGNSSTKSGVYRWDGALAKVVDEDTDFPGTAAVPFFFGSPSLAGRIAVTWSNGGGPPNFAGVYSFDLGGLFAVADTNVGDETFFNVQDGSVTSAGAALGRGAYVWSVNDSPTGSHHIYRRRFDPLGPVELIASTNQQLPDQSFVLLPSNPQVDRSDPDQLCFVGGSPIGAVYRFDGAEIELVADLATPIPNGTGTFASFGLYCSIDDGDVVFSARDASFQSGVYRGRSNGVLEKVADGTDTIDGETGSGFEVGREAISHGRIAFRAGVGSEPAIVVTPEPGESLSIAAVLVALAALQRRRATGFASASRRATSASTL